MANTADFFAIKKPRVPLPSDAFDPGIDVGSGDSAYGFSPATSAADAIRPTLRPASDAARSPTGGANGSGISPMDPSHQYMQDLQDVSGKLSAALAAPRPGMGRQILGALLAAKNPQIGGLVSGETQRARSIEPLQQEYGVLGQLITANRAQQLAQATMEKDQAMADNLRGRNIKDEIVANTRAGASGYGADQRLAGTEYSADKRLEGQKANLGPMLDVPQDLQDQFGAPPKLPVRHLNALESAAGKPLTVVQGQNGPSIVNKIQAGRGLTGGQARNLGVGSPSMGRAVQVADPNNPGNTVITTAGQAMRTGAAGTQSASLQVPRQAAKAEVPTNIGDQKVNFSTMIQHADLLRKAAKALNNGDEQTLSGLKNAFKNEFGYSGPITAQAIADAYGGEVTNVIAKGHITDAEAAKTGKTIDLQKQNYKTVNDVLSAYQALAQSKMDNLNKQEQSAISNSQRSNNRTSQPGNGAGDGAGGGAVGAASPSGKNDPLGIR